MGARIPSNTVVVDDTLSTCYCFSSHPACASNKSRGRGSGANDWIGNQTFRETLDARRNDFAAALTKTEKTEVALQVVRSIKARNGRFLTRVDKATSFVVEDGVWAEFSEREAVENSFSACLLLMLLLLLGCSANRHFDSLVN